MKSSASSKAATRGKYYRRWLVQAPAGLTLVGVGLSLQGEAATRKQAGQKWFWLGTLALVTFNAGLSVFGEAVVSRARYLREDNP